MNNKSLFISVILLAFYSSVSAQQKSPVNDTVIKASTIEITQEISPKLSKLINLNLCLHCLRQTMKNLFSIKVPQQSLYYSYSSLPLRPLALGKDSIKAPFDNYVKAGFGN